MNHSLSSFCQAEDTTNRVLTTLHGQTEQLHRIQADAEAINHNLDRSEWLLRALVAPARRVTGEIGCSAMVPTGLGYIVGRNWGSSGAGSDGWGMHHR